MRDLLHSAVMIERRWAEHTETCWRIARQDPDAARSLAERVGTSPLVAQILINREIAGEDEARSFLSPRLGDLEDPTRLPGLAEGAREIHGALRAGQPLLVYGDYDVDGMTGTALLVSLLGRLGAEVTYYIPDRRSEGYGLNPDAVRRIAEDGVGLLITVDHGTTANEEVTLARELGMDVVVLDHHTPSGEPPPATALVNPHLAGGMPPFPCGVGVAFKVAWEVARLFAGGPRVSDAHREFLKEALGLVALGTVADVVPLRGENRLFVHFGLKVLAATRHPGLRALVEVADLADGPIAASDLGFRLAPRLNAAGRLGRTELALELLLTDSTPRAREIASILDGENRRRQKIEGEILTDARSRVESEYDAGHPGALVMGDKEWHPGVIGIVASRLVERYHRPAVLVAFDGDIGRGSCRTIPALELPAALSRCSEHLVSFGGHAAAAGLTVRAGRFDAFREAFDEVVRGMLEREDLVRKLRIDVMAPLSAVSPEVVRDIDRLAPFGEGNPRPVFATRGARVAGRVRRMGGEGQHLSFLVSDGVATHRAIGFGMGPLAGSVEKSVRGVDIAYTPRFDTWRRDGSLELGLSDVSPSQAESPGERERFRS
jgi:single-stranded-DNA-specific exonuclease